MDSFNLIKLSCVKFGNQPELTNFRADYQGFTLKEDFLYGKNLRGQAVASSGWTFGEYLFLYTRTETGWNKGQWYPFYLLDLPEEFLQSLEDDEEEENE